MQLSFGGRKNHGRDGAGIGLGQRVATDGIERAGVMGHNLLDQRQVNLTVSLFQHSPHGFAALFAVAAQSGWVGINKKGLHSGAAKVVGVDQ
jgi:hypothetical protein